ncbi:STAS domain-containing protein [Amycolatopsis australiensis]|uniref:Anti-sigma B factor antagonist n=1 Tax=Amycolatopsis australiensis TaxID=546364 RepID=A0A1K1SMJ5_9PSEU|nr:STAS domain-containing protein [Amycolatopsis australiensis]SFW85303.1 anti-sigma B factor antagonist [Amycolatopsis australiensis]
MDAEPNIPALAGPLEIHTETRGDGVRTIRLDGAVDLTDRDRLHAEFDAALAARPTAVEVDMTGVGFCSSTGLEALVRLQASAREAQVPVRIRPTARLRRLIDITGLSDALNLTS